MVLSYLVTVDPERRPLVRPSQGLKLGLGRPSKSVVQTIDLESD
jgi:hypothetical protein